MEETFSSLSSNPLFSTIFSLYTLLLLYFPSLLPFSPVIFSAVILLLYLLRLGAEQNSSDESDSRKSSSAELIEDYDHVREAGSGFELNPSCEPDPNENNPNRFYSDSFVEWDVRAPLEVIYEEYEGEEAEGNDGARESEMNIIQRYASLSLFYPESDGESSSEGEFPASGSWNSPENMCFRWEDEDEDDRDGLIEIALDEKRNCEVEEENLIEIDLSPAR